MQFTKKSAAVGLLAAVSGALFSGVPTAESATTCSANHEIKAKPLQWDDHRVRAYCTQINSDDKVRGTLQVRLDVDSHTVWFTGTSVNKYSSWRTLTQGEYQGVRYDVAER